MTVEHLVKVSAADGDDTICKAEIDDWSCLIIQNPVLDAVIDVLSGEGSDYDAIIVIPTLWVEALGEDIITVIPRLVGFAYEFEL